MNDLDISLQFDEETKYLFLLNHDKKYLVSDYVMDRGNKNWHISKQINIDRNKWTSCAEIWLYVVGLVDVWTMSAAVWKWCFNNESLPMLII